MKKQVILLGIAILFLTSPVFCDENVCSDSIGANYIPCSFSSSIMLKCCTEYTQTGNESQTYKVPGGNINITIQAWTPEFDEAIIISSFECDGSCKDLVIGAAVVLPLTVRVVNPRFTIQSSNVDSFLMFSVDGPQCVCEEGIEGENPCKQVFLENPRDPISGVYKAIIDGVSYEIFCDFKYGSEGFVYISQNAIKRNNLHIPLEKFHNDDTKACLKFKSANGQKDSVLEQLPEYSSIPFSFQINAHEGYVIESLDDIVKPPYIFLGLIPENLISKGSVQGYIHNKISYVSTFYINKPISYFAFVAKPLTGTHLTESTRWTDSATDAVVNLPDGFFYDSEEHHGHIEDYFHGDWVALGLPFNY